MLSLDDTWIWDSWVADDGDRYHLFFLKASKELTDAGRRHVNATVGHATSTDLVTWDYLGECFGPSTGSGNEGAGSGNEGAGSGNEDAGTGSVSAGSGSVGPAPSFDDLAIWTGSVVHDGQRWRMFYTAISHAGHHIFDQRVGSAVSDDLHHWTRTGTAPVVLPDSSWYKTLSTHPSQTTGPDVEHSSETWRDPLVLRDPGGDGWHLLLSARDVSAGRNDDGVVAHATSPDLETWTLAPPLCAPGAGFGQLEVLQSKQIDGRWVLVFTCHPQEMTPARRAELGEHCTWSVPSPGPLGPWDVTLARPFTAEPDLFAAPLVQQRDGSWAIVGFRNTEPRGEHNFHIIDPIAVGLDDDGYLVALT